MGIRKTTKKTKAPLRRLALGQLVTWKTSAGGKTYERSGTPLAFVPGGMSLQKDAAFRKATGEDITKVGSRLQGSTLHVSDRYLVMVGQDDDSKPPLYHTPLAGSLERAMGAAPFGGEKIAFLDRTAAKKGRK